MRRLIMFEVECKPHFTEEKNILSTVSAPVWAVSFEPCPKDLTLGLPSSFSRSQTTLPSLLTL